MRMAQAGGGGTTSDPASSRPDRTALLVAVLGNVVAYYAQFLPAVNAAITAGECAAAACATQGLCCLFSGRTYIVA
jgi:hypothetical protein